MNLIEYRRKYLLISIKHLNLFGCSALDSVTLHPNTTSIPNYAFADSGITKLLLPSKIDSIGDYAFANAEALEAMSTDANDLTTSKAGEATPTLSGKLVLPATIKSLGTTAFANTKFTSADLSKVNSITVIPTGTFKDTPTLVSVKLSTKTSTISTGAFTTTSSLSSVNFDALTELATIDTNNFNGANFATLDLSKTIISEVKENTFANLVNTSLTNVKLPLTITNSIPVDSLTIATSATEKKQANISFGSQDGISEVPTSLKEGTNTSSLNQYGYKNILNVDLTSMSNLTTISGGTFTGSTVLETLTLPAKATTFEMTTANKLDTAAFNGNNSLSQIEYQKFGTDNTEIVLTKENWDQNIKNNDQLWNTIVTLMNSVGRKDNLQTTDIMDSPNPKSWPTSDSDWHQTDLTKAKLITSGSSLWWSDETKVGSTSDNADAEIKVDLVTLSSKSIFFKHNNVVWKWTQNHISDKNIIITLETVDNKGPMFYKTTTTTNRQTTNNIALFGNKPSASAKDTNTLNPKEVKIKLEISILQS